MEENPQAGEEHAEKLQRLQHEENRLWRAAVLFLVLLTAGLAATSWQNLASIPNHLEALPLGMLVLGVLFAVYLTRKRREIAELQGVVRGLQEREKAPPSEEQLHRLLEAISNSQRNYRELIDSLDEAVLGLSLQGTIRTTNHAFVDMLGKSFAEIAGHNLEEFLDEPTREQAEKQVARFLQWRQWSGVLRVRFKHETAMRYFDTVLHPIVANGEVVGIGVMAKDITASRERETRFTELFETLQEGVYFTTPEGSMLDCNMALVRMLGYDTKEELLAIPVPQLFLDSSERREQVRVLEQSAALRCQEVRLKRKDGSIAICLDTARAICDDSGKLVRLQGALFDITERRQVEDRLQRQEEFGRRLVESFPDLILALDHTGRYTFVSPRIREILGYEPERFMGRSMSDEEAPVAAEELQQLFRELLTGQEVFQSAEYGAQHRDGTWRSLRATASPMYDAQGKLTGVVASVRDVTSLKQMEQQLIQTERLAAMGQMIDGFAHELNNPLTAILGAVELLQATTPPEAGAARKFELLKQQAKRAAEVVQNLLFFARPPAPGQAPVNISDMVQRSLQLHEHSLKVNSIAVDFIPDPDLPEVEGDPHQIMQVFLNLIINAEQAIREIRPRGTLRVRLGKSGDKVWIGFQDDGPGISPEALPKIFDPFFTTKRPGRGTGLGLSVAMAILKKYGGTIEAQAAPGGGSVFTVTLPTATPKTKPPSARAGL
ncbi:MAG: PAS domain S-box protein [Acidobacteriia bacterium]|nr:PAS domain S-box protein [Terriglobia bacterium]